MLSNLAGEYCSHRQVCTVLPVYKREGSNFQKLLLDVDIKVMDVNYNRLMFLQIKMKNISSLFSQDVLK